MLETIKLVGAIVGLATGVFTVWDRWVRGRPLAWVTAKQAGANAFTYIRIENPGPADVFIVGVRAHPPIYRVARDHREEAIGDAMDNVDVNVLLRQGEVYDLPIFQYPDRPKEASSQSVRLAVSWRKTSSTWLWQFPVRVFTSTDDIQRIKAAVAARRD